MGEVIRPRACRLVLLRRAAVPGEDSGTTKASDNPLVSEPLQIDLLQPGDYQLDLAKIVPALGVEQFWVVDPFEVDAMTQAWQRATPPATGAPTPASWP